MEGSIGWVFSTGNVSSDDGAVCFIHEGMNAFEGVVWGLFRLCLFHQPSTTPLLSLKTLK